MAEPGIGELAVVDSNSWEEIVKRGGFESLPPQVLGDIPNPESFHILPPDAKANGILDLANLASSEGLPPSFLPTIDEILAHERSIGTSIDDKRWFWNRAGRGNRPPHTDASPPYGDLRGQQNPVDVIRWTVGTHGGTSFYPGHYDIRSLNLHDDEVRRKGSTGYDELIAFQAGAKKQIITPALTAVRFRGLDVHSPPPDNDLNQNRVLFSLTGESKRFK